MNELTNQNEAQSGLSDSSTVLAATDPKNGYLRNCYIEPKRDGTPHLFRCNDDYAIAYLDGYAIIPMETYLRLKDEALVANAEITGSEGVRVD
jgi:hypothetical protein